MFSNSRLTSPQHPKVNLFTPKDEIPSLDLTEEATNLSFQSFLDYLDFHLGVNNPIKILNKDALKNVTDFNQQPTTRRANPIITPSNPWDDVLLFDFTNVPDESCNALIELYRDETHIPQLLTLFHNMIDSFHRYISLWQWYKSNKALPRSYFRSIQRRKYHFFYIIWINLHALYDAFPNVFHHNEKTSTMSHYSAYINATVHLTDCMKDGVLPWMYPDSGITSPVNQTVEVFYEMVFYAKKTIKEYLEAHPSNHQQIDQSEYITQWDNIYKPQEEQGVVKDVISDDKKVTTTYFPREYQFDYNHDITQHNLSKPLRPFPDRISSYLVGVEPEKNTNYVHTHVANTLSNCMKLSDQFRLVPIPHYYQLAVCLEGLLGMTLQYLHRTPVLETSPVGFSQLLHINTILFATPQLCLSDFEYAGRLAKNLLKPSWEKFSDCIQPHLEFINSAHFHAIFTQKFLSHLVYPLTPSLEPNITNILSTDWSGVLSPLGRFFSESSRFHAQVIDKGRIILPAPTQLDLAYQYYENLTKDGKYDFEMVFTSSIMIKMLSEYNRWMGYRSHRDQRYHHHHHHHYHHNSILVNDIPNPYHSSTLHEVNQFGAVLNKQYADQSPRGRKWVEVSNNAFKLSVGGDNDDKSNNNSPSLSLPSRSEIPALPSLPHLDQSLQILNDHNYFTTMITSPHTDNTPYNVHEFEPSSPIKLLFERYNDPHIRTVILSRFFKKHGSVLLQYWTLFLSNIEHYNRPSEFSDATLRLLYGDLKVTINTAALRFSLGGPALSLSALMLQYALSTRNINQRDQGRFAQRRRGESPTEHDPLAPHPHLYRPSVEECNYISRTLRLSYETLSAFTSESNPVIEFLHGPLLDIYTYLLLGQYGSRRMRYRGIYKNDCKPSKLQFSNVAHYDLYIHPQLTEAYRDTSLNLIPRLSEYTSPTSQRIPPNHANPRLFPRTHDQFVKTIPAILEHLSRSLLLQEEEEAKTALVPYSVPDLTFLHLLTYRNLGENLFLIALSVNWADSDSDYGIFLNFLDRLHDIAFRPPPLRRTILKEPIDSSLFYTRTHSTHLQKALYILYIDTLSYIIKGFAYNGFETNRYNTISPATQSKFAPHSPPSLFQLPDCSISLLLAERRKEKEVQEQQQLLSSSLSSSSSTSPRDKQTKTTYAYNSTRTSCDYTILKNFTLSKTSSSEPIELCRELQGGMVQTMIELFIDLLLDPRPFELISKLDFMATKPIPHFVPLSNNEYHSNSSQPSLYQMTRTNLDNKNVLDPHGVSMFSPHSCRRDINDAPILVPNVNQHHGFFNTALSDVERNSLLTITRLKNIYPQDTPRKALNASIKVINDTNLSSSSSSSQLTVPPQQSQLQQQPDSYFDIRPHQIINQINMWIQDVFTHGPTVAQFLQTKFNLTIPEWSAVVPRLHDSSSTFAFKPGDLFRPRETVCSLPHQINLHFIQVNQLDPLIPSPMSTTVITGSPGSNEDKSTIDNNNVIVNPTDVNCDMSNRYNPTPVYMVNTQQYKIPSLKSMMKMLSKTNDFHMTFTPSKTSPYYKYLSMRPWDKK